MFQLRAAVVDSSTNTLYLGGYFEHLNQYPFHTARSIISYDGTKFDTLQSGIDYQDSASLPTVLSMQMFQNKLYVFGHFKKAGKYSSGGVGRWNGTSWDSLDFQLGLVQHTDVCNGALYIGGVVGTVGGTSITGVAKYDGTNWFDLGHPVPGGAGVSAIKNYNGKLYMAGMVTSGSTNANLSFYDGTSWHPWVGVSGDVNKAIFGMSVIDSMLYIYGRFNSIGGTNCRGLAAYNSKTNTWYGFGSGLSNSTWETIYNVQKIGDDIYVTGNFYTIEDVSTTAGYPGYMKTQIVKLNGDKWCALSPPFDNVVAGVIGFKNQVYAYGPFRQIGQDTLYGFVRWDGGDSIIACSSPFSVTAVPLSINENKTAIFVNVYPNPVSDKLTVALVSGDLVESQIELFNSLGQRIYSTTNLTEYNIIDAASLPSGIYHLIVSGNSGKQVFKIAKD